MDIFAIYGSFLAAARLIPPLLLPAAGSARQSLSAADQQGHAAPLWLQGESGRLSGRLILVTITRRGRGRLKLEVGDEHSQRRLEASLEVWKCELISADISSVVA